MAMTIKQKKEYIKKASSRFNIDLNIDFDNLTTKQLDAYTLKSIEVEKNYIAFLRLSKNLIDLEVDK